MFPAAEQVNTLAEAILTIQAKRSTVLLAGDAGKAERQREVFRRQGVEEGHYFTRRWRGVHDDGKEGADAGPLSSLPHSAVLLLPDRSEYT